MDEIVTLGSQNWFEKLVSGALDFKDKVGGAFKNVKDQVFDFDSDLNGLVTGSVDAMVQGFTDMMSGAKSFKDAMKDMARSIIDSLMKMYVKYMIVQPLFDAMFPGARTAAPAVGGKALGGPVQGNTPYLVGERGPELFVPNSGGNIIPNNKMGGGGGNVVVNQTINVTTGVQQTVRAEIATLMPQIANAAKGAVADARQRGGGFSKALVGA
jgi:phage-related minor tail protein